MTAPWTETLESGRERARIDTFAKSRRVGGSVAAAYRAALWSAGFEITPELLPNGQPKVIAREAMDVILVSKDFVGSKRLLREVADALQDMEAGIGPEFRADVQATSIKVTRTGKTIDAVPCSGQAIRGCTAAFIADEFAFWRRQEDGWAALKSVSDPNFKYPAGLPGLLVTTPWEAGSLAHRIFTDDSFPFRRHSVDIYQAVAAGFPVDPKRVFDELGIAELIDTEYLCKWSRGGGSFFAEAKLRDCQIDDGKHSDGSHRSGLPDGWERAPARFGVDCGGGRGRDFTAIVQWRLIDNAWWMVGLKASNSTPTKEMGEVAAEWILEIDGAVPVHVHADQGIMGADFIRALSAGLKKRRNTHITGVNMAPVDQERYAVAGRRLLERGQFKIYMGLDAGGDENGARAFMVELAQLKTRPGVGGRLTFATPRDRTRGHLDRAWAGLIGLDEADEVPARILPPTPALKRLVTSGRWAGMTGKGFG